MNHFAIPVSSQFVFLPLCVNNCCFSYYLRMCSEAILFRLKFRSLVIPISIWVFYIILIRNLLHADFLEQTYYCRPIRKKFKKNFCIFFKIIFRCFYSCSTLVWSVYKQDECKFLPKKNWENYILSYLPCYCYLPYCCHLILIVLHLVGHNSFRFHYISYQKYCHEEHCCVCVSLLVGKIKAENLVVHH